MSNEPNFEGARLCGVPDHVGNIECLWPFKDVSVYAEGSIGGLLLADATEWAINEWNRVCGIRLVMSTNPKTAHIVNRPAQLDGPSNVLAQCELPCGFSAPNNWRQLGMVCDLSEALVLAANPPANKIDAGRMICHELGHGIGVGHIGTGNLMAPVYSTSIRSPQNGDIVEVRARYGVPVAAPAPAPAPQPSPTPTPSSPFNVPSEISFTIGGQVYRYKLGALSDSYSQPIVDAKGSG